MSEDDASLASFHEQPPEPKPPEGDDGAFHPRRRPTRIRDTVILPNTDLFGQIGSQEIPMPEFLELAALISANFGIKLGENKTTMVTGRIHPLMEKYGFATHRAFIDAIKKDATGELLSELANRISTNHTSFYREETHFQLLQDKVLPEVSRRKDKSNNRDIRIWCAACATGEEAYTILFTLLKHFHFDYQHWQAGVLATDISEAALQVARRGVYSREKVEPIPRDIRSIFFRQVDETNVEVVPEFRGEVTFRRLNLINEHYPFRQPFDIIFCRNVMIYFSRAVRQRLLQRLHDWLAPEGVLFIGHSESLVGDHKGFDYLAPAVYVRSD